MDSERSQQERTFGLSVGGVFCLAAGVLLWRERPLAAAVTGPVGAVLVALALVRPRALTVPSRLWWRVARALGYVNTRLLLTAFYLMLVLPVGLALKLLGRDVLYRRRHIDTGWLPYPAQKNDPSHFRRMY